MTETPRQPTHSAGKAPRKRPRARGARRLKPGDPVSIEPFNSTCWRDEPGRVARWDSLGLFVFVRLTGVHLSEEVRRREIGPYAPGELRRVSDRDRPGPGQDEDV